MNATLGFGRSHARLISQFVRLHPEVEVQLQLSVNPPPLTDDSFDVCIRFGEPPDAASSRAAWPRTVACCAPHQSTWRATGTRWHRPTSRDTTALASAKGDEA